MSPDTYSNFLKLPLKLYVQIFEGFNFCRRLKFSFIFEDHFLSTLELHMHCDCFKKIRGFNLCG